MDRSNDIANYNFNFQDDNNHKVKFQTSNNNNNENKDKTVLRENTQYSKNINGLTMKKSRKSEKYYLKKNAKNL